MKSSVVVVGGGYAGVNAAKALDDVADVTLVDPAEAFVHNVAAWRALVEPEWLDRIFLPYDRLLRHGRFRRDRAVAVDGRRVTLASGDTLEPDYLVLATGSAYPFPAKSSEPVTATAQAKFRAAHQALTGAGSVLLIGAGPSGLELAGEIKAFHPDKRVTVLDSAPDVLTGPYDQGVRDELRRQLDKLGVELMLGSAPRELPATAPGTAAPVTVVTEAGEEVTADVWYRCFGVTPATDYLRGALSDGRDGRGYLRVDEYLRVPGADGVYAIGDIAAGDRDMAGVASRQAEVVAGNIRARITGTGEESAYQPLPPVIIVPLGPDGGSGQFPTGEIATAEQASEIKGRGLLVDRYAAIFDA